MSRLHPALMPLDKGLNLQTAKILAPEGSVLDSLNYEQVDFQGQKRIDGYARYDGSAIPALDDFIVLDPADYILSEAWDDIALNSEGIPFAIQLQPVGDDGLYALATINENAIPEGWMEGKEYVTDEAEHYGLLLTYTAQLRSRIEDLPGGIIGLHWFRDRLYAVADLRVLAIASVVDVLPNDAITIDGVDATVLDYRVIGDRTYILVDSRGAPTSITITRTGQTFAVEDNLAGILASFWESRTEQQVLNEDGPSGPYDFGWKFNHLGWRVPFDEGSSPFGELTSLNQNRQGVGVQGPTSVAGDSGKPLILLQKVNITNLPAQVNGWKTSTSPNVHSLEADALEDVDNVTIYADAYFSWDGATGVVSAPGITGEGMIEYPATNTVVVDV